MHQLCVELLKKIYCKIAYNKLMNNNDIMIYSMIGIMTILTTITEQEDLRCRWIFLRATVDRELDIVYIRDLDVLRLRLCLIWM